MEPGEAYDNQQNHPLICRLSSGFPDWFHPADTGGVLLIVMATPEQIKAARSLCVAEKNKLVAELVAINTEIKGPISQRHRDALALRRKGLVQKMSDVENQINRLNQEKSGTPTLAVKPQSEPEKPTMAPEEKRSVIEYLVILRAEYEEFAADPSRIASRRQMAAEFVLRLNGVIRRAIGKKAADLSR